MIETSGWSTLQRMFNLIVSNSSSSVAPGPPSMFSEPRRMPYFLIQAEESSSCWSVVFLRNTALRT